MAVAALADQKTWLIFVRSFIKLYGVTIYTASLAVAICEGAISEVVRVWADNLDPLWSDSNIDAVAIDCYFPLTPDLPQSQIDYQAVYDGWTQDEGWDYYWDGTRTTQTFYSGATYAWKNVQHWWNSTHTNPDASGTA